jgi:hypothetical protein
MLNRITSSSVAERAFVSCHVWLYMVSIGLLLQFFRLLV